MGPRCSLKHVDVNHQDINIYRAIIIGAGWYQCRDQHIYQCRESRDRGTHTYEHLKHDRGEERMKHDRSMRKGGVFNKGVAGYLFEKQKTTKKNQTHYTVLKKKDKISEGLKAKM